MKLVRLSENCLVNPAEVASVQIAERDESVLVAMRSGETFRIQPSYGQSKWGKLDEIVKRIEVAGKE